MLNIKSQREILKVTSSRGFIKRPLYESYCFSNICGTIENIFLERDQRPALPIDVLGKCRKSYKNVVIFLMDGFGWSLFKKMSKNDDFLKKISKISVVSQLTSQFPSTTAAEMSSLHTDLSVGESGVCEWFYYEKHLDAIINPLRFSFVGDKERNTLQSTGVDAKKIFPNKTFYDQLKKNKIQSSVFFPQNYFPSPYIAHFTKGSKIVSYKELIEGLSDLKNKLDRKGRVYNLFYFDKIDSVSHHNGPYSKNTIAEVKIFFKALKKIFFKNSNLKINDTLFIITADHGQIGVDPKKTIYLNKLIPDLEEKFKKSKSGKSLVPAGSCRDMFLYIKDEKLGQVYKLLNKRLEGKASVHKTINLIKLGFFGSNVRQKLLLERVGNLVILPNNRNLVWWNKDKKFTIKHLAHHGGISLEEMIVPFICFESRF
ncbi:MAG: alkaline phosphatase family protein [Patescibacteria group bacterium]|jgi:predicted AlkP superfamily pyrophosphatase or phosphodiesterase